MPRPPSLAPLARPAHPTCGDPGDDAPALQARWRTPWRATLPRAWPALPLALLAGCDGTVPAGFASLSLLLVAAGGIAVGWLAARVRLADRLRDARRQARLLPPLLGAQAWRSDASQRLVAGPLGTVGDPPWAGFADDAAAAAFRHRLEAQAAVDAQTLVRDGGAWVVAASPLFDRAGGFEGHLGVARPLVEDGTARQALAWLADAAPGAVWVATRSSDAGGDGWQVLHANDAARAAIGRAELVDDEALAAALPAALQAAWHAGDAAADRDGWRWQRTTLAGRCLAALWQPAAPAPAADDSATLSYTVSHDLRAPIRVVEGFTRILKEDYGARLDRIANDHLDRVLGATSRMNQMIDAMLTLARLATQPLARQPVNLSQLAGWVVDDLRRAAPERKAEVEIEPGLQVQGDPTLLRLVLENLIGNAWKYSAQRASARISLTREAIDGEPVFVVRDNGAGFDMRGVDRLFGLFQRLHSASEFPGTGVGLASVRRIVQRHGGRIWATGEPDRGAAFHFTLRE
jgi:signal transduction histidine kinase